MLFNSRIIEPALNAQFEEAYRKMLLRPDLAQVASLFTTVPSTKSEESYAWLGDLPVIKEWIGDKTLGSLKDYKYTIINKDYYTGFSIDRNEIEDDQVGAIAPRISAMAMQVAQYPWSLIVDLIINGHTNLAFDASAFFANRTAPNDNLLAGTGVTLAQVRADIASARSVMMRFTTDSDRVIGLKMDTIVCPPELEQVMLEAVTSTSVMLESQGAVTNPISRWIKNVISLPELSDTTDWYGFCTEMPLKPFIFQSRKAVLPVLDDTAEKRNRALGYSAELRGAAGYGFYQMAVKVVNS